MRECGRAALAALFGRLVCATRQPADPLRIPQSGAFAGSCRCFAFQPPLCEKRNTRTRRVQYSQIGTKSLRLNTEPSGRSLFFLKELLGALGGLSTDIFFEFAEDLHFRLRFAAFTGG